MARPPSRPSYPWGTKSPSAYLKLTSRKVRGALDKAVEPRFSVASQRAGEAVRAARPLVEALEHLAEAGLRARSEDNPLSADDVSAAIESARGAIGELASSSVLTLSESYKAFVTSMEALLQLADEATVRGISASGSRKAGNLWQEFDA